MHLLVDRELEGISHVVERITRVAWFRAESCRSERRSEEKKREKGRLSFSGVRTLLSLPSTFQLLLASSPGITLSRSSPLDPTSPSTPRPTF